MYKLFLLLFLKQYGKKAAPFGAHVVFSSINSLETDGVYIRCSDLYPNIYIRDVSILKFGVCREPWNHSPMGGPRDS